METKNLRTVSTARVLTNTFLHGEVRGVKREVVVWTDKKTGEPKEQQYLTIKIDNLDMGFSESFMLEDYDVSHEAIYERGVTGIFTVRIDVQKDWRGFIDSGQLAIVGFDPDQN